MRHRKTNEQSSRHYTVSLTYLDSVYITPNGNLLTRQQQKTLNDSIAPK